VFNERLSQANRKRDRSTPPATLSVFFVLFYQGEAPEPIKKPTPTKATKSRHQQWKCGKAVAAAAAAAAEAVVFQLRLESLKHGQQGSKCHRL